MSKYKVFVNNAWYDACTANVQVRDSNGIWRRIGHGSKVYANGTWHTITCYTSITGTLTMQNANVNNNARYTVTYYDAGIQYTKEHVRGTFTNYINVDKSSYITITFNQGTTSLTYYNTVTQATVNVNSGDSILVTDNFELRGVELGDGGGTPV